MPMTLWEFPLRYEDGTALDQTVLAEGTTEAEAAGAATAATAAHPGLVLAGPGVEVAPDVAARWREVYGENAFPEVVPNTGRLALYARHGSVRGA